MFMDKCDHQHLFRDTSQISQLQASTKSNIIECSYHMLATVDFDGVLCCSSAPTVEIPIIFYIPDISFNEEKFRPNNWNPQVMPTFEFNISGGGFNVNPNFNNIMIGGSQPIINDGFQPLKSKVSIMSDFQPMMNDGSQPMMNDGSQPMMNDGSQPMMNDGSQPMMNDGSQPMMNDGSQPMMNDGSQPYNNY
jgi:hypothetical protein